MIVLTRQLLAILFTVVSIAPASAESASTASGHRLSETDLRGRTVNYAYDNLYRLTNETIASDPNSVNGAATYTYDPVGNRTQKVSTIPGFPGGLTNYNANDQLATDTYDDNGNTTASTGLGYVYDFENHLIQQGGITMVYDGDGNRVSKTVAGVTTSYLVDTQNPTGYAQVLEERFSGATGPNQDSIHSYVYGLERITEVRFLPAGGTQPIYYVYDGHGSVRALTDSTGAVTDTYDYDAFGNLVHQTGTTPNNYLYSGEQFDPDLNLYYNRARYLNTSTGRFWSMDTDEGRDLEPFSLHKYLYASADPVGRIDPGGNEDLASLSIGSSIGNTLNNITAIQGQAVMDQLQFGGSAGLKSLLLGGAILGGAIAIESFASRFAREVPLLKSSSPERVILNKLNPDEAAFAEEIVNFRGGLFEGPPTRTFPGVDGFLNREPVSLKNLSSQSLGTLFSNVTKAAEQASNAGFAGVELFINGKGFSAKQLLSDPTILPRIGGVVREGTLATVNILTADGWIRVVR